jgi:hypothetical protein
MLLGNSHQHASTHDVPNIFYTVGPFLMLLQVDRQAADASATHHQQLGVLAELQDGLSRLSCINPIH